MGEPKLISDDVHKLASEVEQLGEQLLLDFMGEGSRAYVGVVFKLTSD